MRLYRTIPLADKFWPRVRKTDGCWLWAGARIAKGYGTFGHHNRTLYAHRVSWEVHHGPIPAGLWVLHHCDTPACVRPDHLFLGTAQDNSDDMKAKRRHHGPGIRGEAHYRAKLTAADVRAIRARYVAGGVSHLALAEQYGVAEPTIFRIVHRRSWTHVE